MIGVYKTVHPQHGYAVIIRFKRINSVVSILGIMDSAGKDIFGIFTSAELRDFKSQIKEKA